MHVGDLPEGVAYDPATGTVVVAVRNPDRLLLIDADSLVVERSVPLPGSVRHLQLVGPGGPVIVPCQDADRVLQVRLTDGAVASTTPVGSHPHDATAVDGLVVVGNEFGHSLSVVRGARVVRTISGPDQPGSVVAAGGRVAVVDVGGFTVSVVDPRTGRREGVQPAGSGPTHAAVLPSGELVVVDTRGGRLLRYSVNPLKRIGSYPLPGSPYGIAVDPTTSDVWVTLTATNEVVGIDLSAGRPDEVARYPTVPQPNSVAVAPGSGTLWVTGTANGELERIERR